MMSDLSAHRERFLAYVGRFRDVPDAAPLRLKVDHTFKVLEHAGVIVDSLRGRADEKACRAALLGALYHDCGRFPQFQRYRTFMDAKSVNHAILSFRTMRDEGFLHEEEREVRGLAQCAVLLHNRHILPALLSPRARFVTDIVRDSDKLDIFRIMVGYLHSALPERDAVLLHVQDNPEGWSQVVVDDVLAGRVARYSDLRFVNDFRLLLGTWMLELRFAATRRALAESGLMEAVLAGLPDDRRLRPAREKLFALLDACGRSGEEDC